MQELLSYDVPYAYVKDRDQVALFRSRGHLPKLPKHCVGSAGLNRLMENTLWSICKRCWKKEPGSGPNIMDIVRELESIDRYRDPDPQKYLSNFLVCQHNSRS